MRRETPENISLLGQHNKRENERMAQQQRVLQASFAHSSLHVSASLEIEAAFAFNYYGQFDLNSTII